MFFPSTEFQPKIKYFEDDHQSLLMCYVANFLLTQSSKEASQGLVAQMCCPFLTTCG